MPTISFRKRQGFSDIPCHALTKRIVPAFHVGSLAGLFPDTTVGLNRKHGRIRLPEITKTHTPTKGQGNPVPQASTGTFAVIANHKGDDMTRTSHQDCPEPPFIGSCAHETPGFIDFQHILRLGDREGLSQRRQGLEFFLSRPPAYSGTRQICGEFRAYWAVLDTPGGFLLGVPGYSAVWGLTPRWLGNLYTNIVDFPTGFGHSRRYVDCRIFGNDMFW